MNPLHIRPKAELDIQNTFDWFESQEDGLGLKFAAELRRTLTLLALFPGMYAEKESGFRYALCRKMKVLIAYRIEDSEVLVFRVWYATMNPDQWAEKLTSEL